MFGSLSHEYVVVAAHPDRRRRGADSVKGALDLIEQGTIDAAIVDVALGDEDSAPIAAALCARDIPFAFATGHGGSKVAARFSDAQVLLKPFDFEGLKGMLARLLPR